MARITKIQPRILERIEAGSNEGLPAEVFVRGFVCSYARCVGLNEREAVERFSAARSGKVPAPVAAQAVVAAMSDLAPIAAEAASAASAASAAIVTSVTGVSATNGTATPKPQAQRNRKRRGAKRGAKRRAIATGTPIDPMPVVAAPSSPAGDAACDAPSSDAAASDAAASEAAASEASASEAFASEASTSDASASEAAACEASASDAVGDASLNDPRETVVTEPEWTMSAWTPTMPPAAAPSVPWRRAKMVASEPKPAALVAVIDDADPDATERVLELRRGPREPRRTFLPPILLDRDDRSARQGGLTLAVIILLIVATLTLSYLMRRPSSTGDGMTVAPTASERIG